MCLENDNLVVSSPPAEEEVECWKIFFKSSNHNIFGLFHHSQYMSAEGYVYSSWIQDTKSFTLGRSSNPYLTGFHAYTNKEDAEEDAGAGYMPGFHVVCRVKLRGITARGTQFANNRHCSAIVGREMYIFPNEG